MKSDLAWTKTILTVYRYLERISNAIDKIIMKSALNSSNILGYNYFYNNVYSISQRIIDLSERKVTLINLKLLIEETLKMIDTNDAKLLIEKYFDNTKCKDLAEKRGVSIRTIFRKINNAETSFSKYLHCKGYDDAKMNDWLRDENWINNVYLNFLKTNDDTFVFTNVFLNNAVSM